MERIAANRFNRLIRIFSAEASVKQFQIDIAVVLELRVAARIAGDIRAVRAESGEVVVRRIAASGIGRRAAIVGRASAIWHARVCLQQRVSVVPAHGVRPHRRREDRVDLRRRGDAGIVAIPPAERIAVLRRAGLGRRAAGRARRLAGDDPLLAVHGVPVHEAHAVLRLVLRRQRQVAADMLRKNKAGIGVARVLRALSRRGLDRPLCHRIRRSVALADHGTREQRAVVIDIAHDVLCRAAGHDDQLREVIVDPRKQLRADRWNAHAACDDGPVRVAAGGVHADAALQPLDAACQALFTLRLPFHADQARARECVRAQQDLLHRQAGRAFQPQRRQRAVSIHAQRFKLLLIADRQVGHGAGQLQRAQPSADGQRKAGDGRALRQNCLDAHAAGQIDRHGQVDTVAHVKQRQQLVAPHIQLRQARVGVVLRAVAELEALQLGRHGEIRIAHLQGRQVADGRQTVCAVDVDLRVVHRVQRAGQRHRLVALAAPRDRVAAVLDARPDVAVWALTMMFAGLRRGELLALETKNIDLEKRIIHIVDAIRFENGKAIHAGTTKTDAGIRDVPIYDPLFSILKKDLEAHPRKYLAVKQNGEPILSEGGFRAQWDTLFRRLTNVNSGYPAHWHVKRTADQKAAFLSTLKPVSFTPHDLRYTFATILFNAGVDEKSACKIMGHTDVRMTRDLYAQLTAEQNAKSDKRLEEYLMKYSHVTEDLTNVPEK